ncbi:MAG: DUF1127 domain-containing protein [Ramlibacter sp.]
MQIDRNLNESQPLAWLEKFSARAAACVRGTMTFCHSAREQLLVWRRLRRSEEELRSMSDQGLSDLGIGRSEIPSHLR